VEGLAQGCAAFTWLATIKAQDARFRCSPFAGSNGPKPPQGNLQTMSARAAMSPRLPQLYSPRRPSPLGLPPMGFQPLAPHMAFQSSPSYPKTPDRTIQPKGPPETRVHFPPEARRPPAGTTQRPRSQPPPPALTLNTQHHPPTQPQPATAQPGATQEMSMRSPPSPTPSSTSSLSLYSADSVTKNFPIETVNKQQQYAEDKRTGIFCGCISA